MLCLTLFDALFDVVVARVVIAVADVIVVVFDELLFSFALGVEFVCKRVT